MEDKLNIHELEMVIDGLRNRDYENRKFAAALKGIDLDEGQKSDGPSFEDIQARAHAKNAGISEEALVFGDLGFVVEEE